MSVPWPANEPERRSPDLYDSVLQTIVHLGLASKHEIFRAARSYPAAQAIANSKERNQEIKQALVKLMYHDYVVRNGLGVGKYSATEDGVKRSKVEPNTCCGSRGWCNCGD